MTRTKVIDMHGSRGADRIAQAEEEDRFVAIGRPSKFGNPFKIGQDGTRAEVIAKYREYIMQRPDLLSALPELEGKVLGCWCVNTTSTEPLVCHGQVLLELLQARSQ